MSIRCVEMVTDKILRNSSGGSILRELQKGR